MGAFLDQRWRPLKKIVGGPNRQQPGMLAEIAPKGESLVDELLAERRGEASREDDE